MDIFEILSFSPLAGFEDAKYTDITTDGQYLYLLDQTSQRLFRCDSCLQLVCEYHLQRQYHSICYDSIEKCYWACFNKNNATIYKLNSKFAEVDCFDFISYQSSYGLSKSISFNNKKNCLILTYSNKVVEIDKHTKAEISVKFIEDCTTYKSCISSNNIYYCLSVRNGSEQLSVSCRNQLLIHSCLPADYQFIAMVEVIENHQAMIYILTVKHNLYYYLLKSVLVGLEDYTSRKQCEEDEPEFESCEHCENEHSECAPCAPEPCECNECDECDCCSDCQPCYTELCECCTEEPPCNDCDCNSNCNACDINKSCTDIMESIALVEAAIAHILNAEGEKIQKAVADSHNICEIIEVNESAMNMVIKITQLEQVICSKLEITHKIIKENRCR